MPYVAIPSSLKNVDSISLQLMSSDEMTKMSYGEILTAETINYRTGVPQMNGLFCQAIFGPVKDWECACGKYKRYRYAGVICDKCGVEVTHSSVRRERMGHISLASPCAHPWFLRVIPSRIALLLDIKASDLSKVTYFSAYVITNINEEIRDEYLSKIDKEAQNRVKTVKVDFDNKFQELSRQYQIDKSTNKIDKEALKVKYETDKEILKAQQAEMVTKIETVSEMAKKELSNLKFKDVITEVIYQELSQKFGPVFQAGIGAEAIVTLLKGIDVEKEYAELKEKLVASKGQSKKKIAKRLKLVKHFLNTNTHPQDMILQRIMVLPPDLRPMLQLDGGRFAASDLNELYRRLINRNNRLRKLIQIGAPEVILRNEKRMLQEAVEALIDNSSRSGRQVMASTGVKRPLKSLTDVLKGKGGRFRQNLLGKRVDYSGRSVIIVGPSLKLDQCGLPKEMALELFKPFLMGRIISKSEAGILTEEDQCFNVHSARRLIETKKPVVYDILDEVIKDKYVLLNRAPTLHRLGFLAFKPTLIEGKAIRLHPLVCQAFNADFDGDQMAVHLPITVKGQEEARRLMSSTKNLLKPASGELIMSGASLDIVLGSFYLTSISTTPEKKEDIKAFSTPAEALMALDKGVIQLRELIKVKLDAKHNYELVETSAGRLIFNQSFPDGHSYINSELNKKSYQKLLNEAYFEIGPEKLPQVLDTIKDRAYEYATKSGVSLSTADFNTPDKKDALLGEAREKVELIQESFEMGMLIGTERHRQIVAIWRDVTEKITELSAEALDPETNVGIMIQSGAKGNLSQLGQMVGIRGLSVTAGGHIIELPAQHGYLEGLTGLEYFIGMKGQRKGQADLSLKTADAGYLTRRLVDVAQNLIIMDYDCETEEGVRITDDPKATKSMWEVPGGKLYGRYLAKDVVVDGKTVAKRNDLVDRALIKELSTTGLTEVWVRSATKCELPRGVCQRCYGLDYSTHLPVELGVPIGIIGAQSLGENSTQLTMDQGKHGGGVLQKADVTQGLQRVEELFEARSPKYVAILSEIDGIVESVEGNVEHGYKIKVSSDKTVLTLPYNSSKDMLMIESGSSVKTGDGFMMKPTGEIVKSGFGGKVEIEENQIVIRQSEPEVFEVDVIPGYYLKVKKGSLVKRGEPLTEGAINLQELMDLVGVDDVQNYIIDELSGVYITNGINVSEKHIETIIRQMCNRVQIVDGGDTEYVPGDLIRHLIVSAVNKKVVADGGRPATFKRVITGISRASLTTESFLSAASFQETSKVLVEAVISGRKDHLLGLKENVILGQLIPAGTGFRKDRVDIAAKDLTDDEFDDDSAE